MFYYLKIGLINICLKAFKQIEVLEFVWFKILTPIFSLLLQINIGSKYQLSALKKTYRSISTMNSQHTSTNCNLPK